MRIAAILLVVLDFGCAAGLHPALRAPDLAPTPLQRDEFKRDRAGGVSEEALRAILDAKVELDENQRLGVLPVSESYQPDRAVPLPTVPAELVRALDAAGLFQATSEVSSDWPIDGDIPGLRELAARYRSGYLLLYRQRFVDDARANGWAWLYLTVVGGFVAPSVTLETAGVLEATLFDVRTGTLLFTVYERVHGAVDQPPWAEDSRRRQLKSRLTDQAAKKLAEQVVSKVRQLAAASATSSREQPRGVAGDDALLVGGDDVDGAAGAFGGDDALGALVP